MPLDKANKDDELLSDFRHLGMRKTMVTTLIGTMPHAGLPGRELAPGESGMR